MKSPKPSGQLELQGFRRTLARDWTLALVVAAAALLVRALALADLHGTPFAQHLLMDARGYQEWSLEILRGNWLGDRVFYQEPLYPYLLSLIHLAAGPGSTGVFVVQLAAGVANCVLVQILAARVTGNRWAGLGAGLALAFYQTMVFYEVQVLKPVWTVLLLVALVHVLLSAWECRSRALWLVAGVLMALLGLMRGNTLLYVPFVLAWVFLVVRGEGRKRLLAAMALVVVGVAAPLVAVMLRNAAVGGEFVLSSSHAGFNFYIGNHRGADGAYEPVPGVREDPRYEGDDARAVASARAGRELKASETSGYWFSQAGGFIGRDPAAWLRLLGIKFARFFSAEEVQDTWSPDFFAEHAPLLRIAFLTYVMLMPVAVVGLVACFRRGPRAWLVQILILATVASVVIFYVFGRYRMPVVPLFAVLAAGAVADFVRRVRAGEYAVPAGMLVGAAVAVAFALVSIPSNTPPQRYRADQHVNLGLILFEQAKDHAKAKDEFNRALARVPEHSIAKGVLARVYLAEGAVETARGLLHEAIAADGANADAHFMLAGIYYREKKPGNAIAELERALKARPGFEEAWRDLGALCSVRGEFAQAADVYRRAVAVFPRSESFWQSLGRCYDELHDVARARDAWTRALALAPTVEAKGRVKALLDRLPPETTP